MNFDKYKILLQVYLPIAVIEKIEVFQKRYKLKTKSDAARQLFEAALLIEGKMGLAETWTSKDVADIKAQFESAQLVDYVEQLPRDKFSAIYNIVNDEYSSRAKRR